QSKARAEAEQEGDVLTITLSGSWRIIEPRPSWPDLLEKRSPSMVRLRTAELERWDSSLLLYLFEVHQWCRATGAVCDVGALPEKVRALLTQLSASHET